MTTEPMATQTPSDEAAVPCRKCGKTYAQHSEDPNPRVGCYGLQAFYAPTPSALANNIPEWLAADGCLFYRTLPDGDEISVMPMTFGKARLCLRYVTSIPGTYDDGWCYESRARCIQAAQSWTGEGDPMDGWHRHINTGRRRENGDPAKETLRW